MKKFLSLVLALVMTMSLVTISAGATEYKDFTDKDEIQYAEAVTVLNKLGIITGYSEGDFRPEGELTRGAAAKILVSLLIGPDAAAALGNETSPYPDVPAGNNFAGVISFCKTSKIISGYGDGTFRPQGTLTGYAFAKMLLGALGYSSDYEGFTGPGWNMKVAKLGGEAGLFDRISFNGNATVTREQACQLALNTLKGTMVEYSGGMNITAGDAQIIANPERDYKTSNQEFATHINNRKADTYAANNAGGDVYTVEFGEEHFVDLRMSKTETTARDVFGRPSNEWSWKKVTIGTFPIEPDYVFTTQVAHKDATDAAKNRATGLGGYDVYIGKDATALYVNGSDTENIPPLVDAADIADMTDNGTVVEVYIDDQVADRIDTVVVMKSQLMEVRRVGSDYVSLQKEGNKKVDDLKVNADAYNQAPIDVVVENVQAEDDMYSVLSGLKAGDLVVVTPVADAFGANPKWTVGDAYVPETVNGALTAVDTWGKSGQNDKNAVAVTVGGTNYKISLWARDLYDVNADEVKITRGDVTLYLDRYGYAMKSKDIGDVSDWFIVGRYYNTMVNNRIVTMAEGWDTNGNKMELNLGTNGDTYKTSHPAGNLVRYTNTTSGNADWVLSNDQVALVDADKYDEIKTSDVYIPLKANNQTSLPADKNVYVDKGIKFIYVTFDQDSKEVESIEIKNGVQDVKNTELKKDFDGRCAPAQAGYSLDKSSPKLADAVKVVVVKQESNDAIATNMMYVRTQKGGGVKDANGNMIYCYTVDMMTPNGLEEEITIYSDDKINENSFAAYTAKEHADYSNFFDLRSHNNYTGRTTSTFQATLAGVSASNKYLLRVNNFAQVKGSNTASEPFDGSKVMVAKDPRDLATAGGEAYTVDIARAEFVDLRNADQLDLTRDQRVNSRDDFYQFLVDYLNKSDANDTASAKILGVGDYNWTLQLIINDNDGSSGFRSVAMVVITDQSGPLAAEPTFPNVGGGDEPGPGDTSSETGVTLTLSTASSDIEGSWDNGANVPLTKLVADTVKTIKLTTTSDKAEITGVTASGFTNSPTPSSDYKTLTIGTLGDLINNATVMVTVKAENGDTQRHVFLFEVTDTSVWANKFVVDLMAANSISDGNNGYTESDWTAQDIGTDVTLTGTVLDAPILVTGTNSDVQKQLQSAMKALEIDVALDDIKTDGRGNWNMTKDGFTYTYTEDTTGLAWIKADPDATAKPAIFTIGTNDVADLESGASAWTIVGIVDDNGEPVADPTTAKAVAGHTYTNKGWTKVTIVADRAEADAAVVPTTTEGKYYWSFDVPETIKKESNTVYYLKDGDTIKFTLNLKDVADLSTTTNEDTLTVTATGCKVNDKDSADTAKFNSTSTVRTKEFSIVAPKVGVADVTIAITGANAAKA